MSGYVIEEPETVEIVEQVDEDFKNLQEIEMAMDCLLVDELSTHDEDDYDEYLPKEDDDSSDASAAEPSMHDRLIAEATEFWFPSSQQCLCCSGYRHGCDCVKVHDFLACQANGCCPEEYYNAKKETDTFMKISWFEELLNQNRQLLETQKVLHKELSQFRGEPAALEALSIEQLKEIEQEMKKALQLVKDRKAHLIQTQIDSSTSVSCTEN